MRAPRWSAQATMPRNMSTDLNQAPSRPVLPANNESSGPAIPLCLRLKGRIPYRRALELQRRLQAERVEARKRNLAPGPDLLMLVDHNPVITLGRHAESANLLLTRQELERRGVEVFDIERGGDVTFHGPGQLVAYLIVDLQRRRLGVKRFVWILEEAVIRTIARWGLRGERVEGATGVWLAVGEPGERKICAIGIKCTRFITMHGLALNVSTDMRNFQLINPCGFQDKGVASMLGELGPACPSWEQVAGELEANLRSLLA